MTKIDNLRFRAEFFEITYTAICRIVMLGQLNFGLVISFLKIRP